MKDPIAVRVIATCVDVAEARRAAYLEHLAQRAVPVWRALVADGALAGREVFEQVGIIKEADDVPAWRFLHLATVADGVDPDDLIQREARALAGADFADAEVLRSEVMVRTPLGYLARPAAAAEGRARAETPAFTLEYIDVDAPFLNEYRLTMMLNAGPAFADLVAAAAVHSFRAFETEAVQSSRPGLPHWNQLHVIGVWPNELDRLWPALDDALKRVNPEGHGLKEVFGRLPAIRRILRMSANERREGLSLVP